MWLGKSVGLICSYSPQLEKEIAIFHFPERNNNYNQEKPEDRKCRNKDVKNEKNYSETAGRTWRDTITIPKGFLNLAAFLLFLLSLRCSLWLTVNVPPLSLPSWGVLLPDRVPVPPLTVLLYPLQAVLVTLNVERFLADGNVSSSLAALVHSATVVLTFAIPVLYLGTELHLEGLVMNVLITVTYLVLAMKLTSFVLVNKKEREKQCNSGEHLKNRAYLEMKAFIFYWMSPSLVYRHNSVRKYKMNTQRLMIRVFEIALLSPVVRTLFLLISVTTSELLEASKEGNICIVVDRFLSLSLMFNVSWLSVFYMMFVSFLPLMSELSGSHEKDFFQSWWDAENLEQFWRRWNLPVHSWCVKHLYLPVVQAGWSKVQAMIVVFLASAALHEFLISSSLRVLGHTAFLAFLSQSLLCKISSWVHSRYGGTAGNIFVWSILVLGNTGGVIIYYKQVLDTHFT